MKASAPLQTAGRRPLVVVVVVVVVVAATPNYLRQASQNLGKYLGKYSPDIHTFQRLFKTCSQTKKVLFHVLKFCCSTKTISIFSIWILCLTVAKTARSAVPCGQDNWQDERLYA